MSFDEITVQRVWQKGQIVFLVDPNIWRKDQCNARISRFQYGNRNSDYGWEIDHIIATSNGGSDDISNLRPLQWENNLRKSDGQLACPVSFDGTKNIHIRARFNALLRALSARSIL